MEFTNISHIHPSTKVTHINYRLAGSVPRSVLARLKEERAAALRKLEISLTGVPPTVADEVRKRQQFTIDGKLELEIDNYLDKATNGPYYLKEPAIAQIVMDSLKYIDEEGSMELYAACVMSNHVHLLVACPPDLDVLRLDNLMGRHKTHTAKAANKLLARTGQSFWQSNYFDRYVRPGKFLRVLMYVLNNPVKAGLVDHWSDWPHTYLRNDLKPLVETL